MLAAYYADFNVEIASFIATGKWSSTDDLGPYYLENGTFEVKGMNVVARGGKQIDDFYRTFVRDATKGTSKSARIYAAFTDPRVIVHGGFATAEVMWMFIAAMNSKATPQILGIGREHDVLVKRNGHWYFKRRVVLQ